MGGWECGRLFDAFFRAARKAGMLGEAEMLGESDIIPASAESVNSSSLLQMYIADHL